MRKPNPTIDNVFKGLKMSKIRIVLGEPTGVGVPPRFVIELRLKFAQFGSSYSIIDSFGLLAIVM